MVKAEACLARAYVGDVEDVDGITLRWDPDDPESDPSSEFPFGC